MAISYIGSTGLVTATVTNRATGAKIDDATVTIAIDTSSGTSVLAATAMTAEGGGTGRYTYTVSPTLLSVGVDYLFQVLAIDTGGNRFTEHLDVTAERSYSST